MSRSQHPAWRSPRWQREAACRPHPTSWWFTADDPDAVEAFVICTECEVRSECLAFALEHPDLTGIWAATTDPERELIRRLRPPE